MKANYNALIFDLDGTLWDTASVCAAAWNKTIRTLGKSYREIFPADIANAMGLTADALRAKIFYDLPSDAGLILLKKCFDQEVADILSGGTRFYPGVIEGIPKLAKKYQLFIVSNCDAPYLEAFLTVSKLKTCFQDWECHGNTGLTKAENLSLLIRRNSISGATYIGDTSTDAAAAKSAGVPFFFMEYGFGTCQDATVRFADFQSFVKQSLVGHCV